MRQSWSDQGFHSIATIYCLARLMFLLISCLSFHNGWLVLREIIIVLIWTLCNLIVIHCRHHPMLLKLIFEISFKYRTLAQFHQITTVICHVKWLHCLILLILWMGRATSEFIGRLEHISIQFLYSLIFARFLCFRLHQFECFFVRL